MIDDDAALSSLVPSVKEEARANHVAQNNTSFVCNRCDVEKRQSTIPNQRENTLFSRISPLNPNGDSCGLAKTVGARWKSIPLKRAERISPPTSFGDQITAGHKLMNLDGVSRNYHRNALAPSFPCADGSLKLFYLPQFQRGERPAEGNLHALTDCWNVHSENMVDPQRYKRPQDLTRSGPRCCQRNRRRIWKTWTKTRPDCKTLVGKGHFSRLRQQQLRTCGKTTSNTYGPKSRQGYVSELHYGLVRKPITLKEAVTTPEWVKLEILPARDLQKIKCKVAFVRLAQNDGRAVHF